MSVNRPQVKLEIFSEKENVDQLDWAMESLKVRLVCGGGGGGAKTSLYIFTLDLHFEHSHHMCTSL